MKVDIEAERRALERPMEITPRNSQTPDDDYMIGPVPPEPQLQSDLAKGIAKELELLEKPLVLHSELALQALESVMKAEEIVLKSPLARRISKEVSAEEKSVEAKLFARSGCTKAAEESSRPVAKRGLFY